MPKLLPSLLFSCILLCSYGCRQTPAEVQINTHVQFIDGAAAAAIISQDPDEGYFDHWSISDARLQMGLPDTTAISLSEYEFWLSALPQVWPPELQSKMERVWQEVLSEFFTLYPGLELDDIQLILTRDEPYGTYVYFTRQNAVICPITDLEEAPEGELLQIMRHELFHLLSRKYSELRQAVYGQINFQPVQETFEWPSDLYERRLLNPDAPFPDYALELEGKLYIPLVYAAQSPYNPDNPDHFAEQLRFSYFQLADGKASRPVLSVDQVMKATGNLTDYVLHPEEILADQFALLLQQGGPKNNRSLQMLDKMLRQAE